MTESTKGKLTIMKPFDGYKRCLSCGNWLTFMDEVREGCWNCEVTIP